jgi:hypothetical protein
VVKYIIPLRLVILGKKKIPIVPTTIVKTTKLVAETKTQLVVTHI